MAYNHIEKFIVLCKSDRVRIWEYTHPKSRYVYWLLHDDHEDQTDGPQRPPTGEYDTIEELIDAAYSHIDPLLDANND
jgi:hypothetical protein